jgi:hypothetical protein
MLQFSTNTGNTFALSTADNRIYTHTLDSEKIKVEASRQIRFLFKIVNDMSKDVTYVYPTITNFYNRYTLMSVSNLGTGTPDMFAGQIKLTMSGHYTYEVYEVSWGGNAVVTETTAPASETQVFDPASSTKGVVRGLVTKGTMYMDDKAGTEQVQYTQHETTESNYIYYGQ